jgi:hypothetical protein
MRAKPFGEGIRAPGNLSVDADAGNTAEVVCSLCGSDILVRRS